MATITLEYDGRNRIIKQLIDVLLAVGAKEKKGYAQTMQAIAEFERGETTVCDSFEDYLKKIKE